MKESFFIEPFVFSETSLQGSYIIDPQKREDNRGCFFRSYAQEAFEQAGLNIKWVQMNHSYTKSKGTLRGMHFQHPPFAEVKLLRCIAGSVSDVIVDLREGSKTFLQWVGVELSAENKKMLYIPKGFAHGFQTLLDDTELVYMHSENYNQNAEGGMLYNDAQIGITWPLPVSIISERDSLYPILGNDFTGIKLL